MKNFEQIIGYEDIKLELARVLDTIKHQEKYNAIGAKTPTGILLYGKPGIGKTMFSNAFLKASERPYFVCRKDKPNGEFVKAIKDVFDKAMEAAPSIVLLDDMDKFANEDYNSRDAEEYVTVQSCIDTIKAGEKDVFIFATANDFRKLPNSLVRAGRFDKVIEMGVPNVKDAAKIIKHYLSTKETVDDLDCDELAHILEGNSCAELESVINEAGIYAAFDGKEKIGKDDIIRAIMRLIFDAPESVEPANKDAERSIAVHEAGHAVATEILEPGSVNLVSINRHAGNTGGITSSSLSEDYWYSIKHMENRVVTILAGKAATEIKFGVVDVGSNSDMHRAFDMVERFVDHYCGFGFDKFTRNDSSPTLLEKKETYIHSELDRYYKMAKQILVENIGLLDRLTEELVSKKTITASDIAKMKSA